MLLTRVQSSVKCLRDAHSKSETMVLLENCLYSLASIQGVKKKNTKWQCLVIRGNVRTSSVIGSKAGVNHGILTH